MNNVEERVTADKGAKVLGSLKERIMLKLREVA